MNNIRCKIIHYENSFEDQFFIIKYKLRWWPFWMTLEDADDKVIKFKSHNEVIDYIEKARSQMEKKKYSLVSDIVI